MNNKFNIYEYIIHIIGLIPILVLSVLYFTDSLSINPIESLEQQTGRIALIFLVLSLACSPFNKLFRFSILLRWRKPLGLYAFMYALIHIMIFVGLDFGFDFQMVWGEIQSQSFLWLGAAGFLLLTPAAITSTPHWQRRLGKSWKTIHYFVYFSTLLILIHYFLVVKGNLFRLQGNFIGPVLFSIVILALLLFRLPKFQKILSFLAKKKMK